MILPISSDAAILALDLQHSEGSAVPAMLSLPGTEPGSWPRMLLDACDSKAALSAVLPAQSMPFATVCCTMGPDLSHADSEGCAGRMEMWTKLLAASHGRPSGMALPVEDNPDLPCFMTEGLPQNLPGNVFVIDGGAALANALLSVEKYKMRDLSEGCTVIYAGKSHVQALLTFRGAVVALYEQHTPILPSHLQKDLKELRLNWLPMEKVRSEGGHGCLCGTLPEEAESFIPTWISGPASEAFASCGRIFHPSGSAAFDCCMGAILAIRSQIEAEG